MLIKLEFATLSRIKDILVQFGDMSGLKCNVEKTNLLLIGDNIILDNRINELGFNIVNSLTVLGLEVDGNGATAKNFSRVTEKIKALIANWRPYNLSLPGRIAIAKSMLYSQINYLGCFLTFPTECIASIENSIASFVNGKLNVAKKRLFCSPRNGGLGLFELESFLHAQRCAWIKRCIVLDEQWKAQLYINNFGNVFNCKAQYTNPESNPVLFGISKSFELMYENYVKKDENFRSAYIVGTRTMTRNLETREFITNNFFGNDFFAAHAGNICRLKYNDFYSEGGALIPADVVIASTGVPLTVMMIQTLRGVCTVAKTKYRKKNLDEQVTVDIITFIQRCKRGSKRFRFILTRKTITEIPHNINKYARNMDIIVDGSQSDFLNNLWTVNFFNNSMKTFLFKLHNNTLGYNSAVAHFVRNHSPSCTFCDLAGHEEENIEKGSHIFYDCVHVAGVIDYIFDRVTMTNNFEFSRREFFSTFNRRELIPAKNLILTYLSKFVIKALWDCKQRFTIPNAEECWEWIKEDLLVLFNENKKFRKLWENSGFSL
jgi:hypothetical protein